MNYRLICTRLRLFLTGFLLLSSLVIGSVQPVFSDQSKESMTEDNVLGSPDFLQKIQQASDKVNSFSASFVQERRLALFTQPVIFQGQLTVVRPDRLRWEFSTPIPSVLIFNGENGLRCNDGAAPVHFSLGSDHIMRTVAEQLWLWLGGDYGQIGDRYHLAQKGENSLVILPKEKAVSDFIGAVTISFNQESWQPEQVEILEPGGDSTLISFHDYQLNSFLPATLFSNCASDE